MQQGDTVSEQEIREKTRGILADEENLRTFAELNNMTTTAARALLERLLREPVVSEKVEEHIFSGDSAESLKDYYAGEEKGYVRRERNTANHREVFVHLTDEAKHDLTSCEQDHDRGKHLITRVLSESEINQLSSLLQKLNQL